MDFVFSVLSARCLYMVLGGKYNKKSFLIYN